MPRVQVTPLYVYSARLVGCGKYAGRPLPAGRGEDTCNTLATATGIREPNFLREAHSGHTMHIWFSTETKAQDITTLTATISVPTWRRGHPITCCAIIDVFQPQWKAARDSLEPQTPDPYELIRALQAELAQVKAMIAGGEPQETNAP